MSYAQTPFYPTELQGSLEFFFFFFLLKFADSEQIFESLHASENYQGKAESSLIISVRGSSSTLLLEVILT